MAMVRWPAELRCRGGDETPGGRGRPLARARPRRDGDAPDPQRRGVTACGGAGQPAGHNEYMSFVAINVLSVPEGSGSTLEDRFAGRAGSVEQAPGFEYFELLRPLAGTDDYLVYTRWRSKEDFEEWTRSQSFSRGHAQASGRDAGAAPAASGSTIWQFEPVQQAEPPRA